MGCENNPPNWAPENFCGDSDPENPALKTADVQNSCFFTTEPGSFCGDAGIPGNFQRCFGEFQGSTEWIPGSHSTGCGVCSSCKGIEQGNGSGTCGFGTGSCTWAGRRYKCQRRGGANGYQGDPLKCCRRSKAIQGNTLFCFDDNSKLRTCLPSLRGFDKPSCVPLMAAYCSNDSEEPMTAKWTGSPQSKDCLRFVSENQGNLNFYQDVTEAMVRRYLITQNNPITSIQSDGPSHDPFIDTVVEVCRSNPGACDNVLFEKCAGVQREQIEQNINLANLCGCFMEDVEYSKFSQFGIDRVCDPLCVLSTTVKPLDTTSSPTAAKFQVCTQSICVIDDITIQLLAGSVAGDITFAQACGSCAENQEAGSCRCYISDVDIQAINSRVGDVNFEQTCGNPVCYQSSEIEGQPPIQVDCASGIVTDQSAATGLSSTGNPSSGLWIALAILIALLILILVFSRSRGSNTLEFIQPEQPQARPLIGAQQPAGGSAARSRGLVQQQTIARNVV